MIGPAPVLGLVCAGGGAWTAPPPASPPPLSVSSPRCSGWASRCRSPVGREGWKSGT
ncbi:hypothetical protein [Ornithinimicrobium kibberense]|uniref:hypothetical protein n=1 Tax=Ornithinimicrobium kibberense TaxID=282060 RepID=UPI00361CB769